MHDFPLVYTPYATGFTFPFPPVFLLAVLPFILLAVVWTIAIKGYALWHAARAGQKGWFIVLLIVNTLGILELIYLVWFRMKTSGTVSSVPKESD